MFQALRTDNSPFTAQQIEQLQSTLVSLDASQSAWLSGYIAGQLARSDPAMPALQAPSATVVSAETFHVLYASQTGTGETIAAGVAEKLEALGWSVRLQSMASVRPAQIRKLNHAAIVISTHGEGDPPDDAMDWFEFLQGQRVPRLESLRFTVLALGDRSYEKFCEAGRQLEQLLLAAGATTWLERVECDLDYTANADQWTGSVLAYARERLPDEAGKANMSASHLSIVPNSQQWSRSRPFRSTLERVQKITSLESTKDVYHIELSLVGSGIEYQPGDSLGIWASNNHEVVSELLDRLSIPADAEIELDGHHHTAHELLCRHREITRLSADTVVAYASAAGQAELAERFEKLDAAARREFIEARQFIDLVVEYPPQEGSYPGIGELSGILRPLAPRSYSIASSQALVEDEVHLTVATLHSNAVGELRRGVASSFLNHQLQPGDEVGVFLEPNRRFRLPENRQTPLILVAAGTGIAPYRAFLQQLEEEQVNGGSTPPVWLIFGNPHLRHDFLYQREWLEWRDKGLLTRVDGAFSRDQEEKVYVQHVITREGNLLHQWLDEGASIYLCGGLAMGHEVELAIQDVLASHGNLETELAARKLADLRRQGRILKDLY